MNHQEAMRAGRCPDCKTGVLQHGPWSKAEIEAMAKEIGMPCVDFYDCCVVPVFTGTIQGKPVQLCDARTLHTFMGVLRDFTTWIKARIRKFKFVEGVDFAIVENLSSPNLVSSKARAQTLSDYHLTLDMAKELSMVENNEKGREARRYFMECERQVLAALTTHPTDRISPAQAQHLRELVQLVVESGKQSHGETWNRLHRKMQVNSYLNLHPSKFDAAAAYLRGKMDGQSMAALIQKHYPNEVLALQPPVAPPAPPKRNVINCKVESVAVTMRLTSGGVGFGIRLQGDHYNMHRFAPGESIELEYAQGATPLADLPIGVNRIAQNGRKAATA